MLKRDIIQKPRRKKKGQSTLEYIILVAAVVAAMIAFLPGSFRNAYERTLNEGTNGMENMAGRLSASRPMG